MSLTAGGAISRFGGSSVRRYGRFARNPVKYARGDAAGGALLIFLTLIAIASIRRGRWPTWNEAGTFGAAAIVVLISAQLMPELVTWMLVAALAVAVAGNAGLVTDYVRAGFNRVAEAAA